MQNLDIIVLTSVLSGLFIYFAVSVVKEINNVSKPDYRPEALFDRHVGSVQERVQGIPAGGAVAVRNNNRHRFHHLHNLLNKLDKKW